MAPEYGIHETLSADEREKILQVYTPEQQFSLSRLASLRDKRRELEGDLDVTDWRNRLLRKALFSTYQDCRDQGVEDAAKEILNLPKQAANP